MKRFLDLADFEREEVVGLLELAHRLETRPELDALAGKILGLVFFNPSLRTLASFQAAMARLGEASGAPIVTEALARAAALAASAGAAAKPSGAGGGDCAVVIAFGDEALARAERALAPHFETFRVAFAC